MSTTLSAKFDTKRNATKRDYFNRIFLLAAFTSRYFCIKSLSKKDRFYFSAALVHIRTRSKKAAFWEKGRYSNFPRYIFTMAGLTNTQIDQPFDRFAAIFETLSLFFEQILSTKDNRISIFLRSKEYLRKKYRFTYHEWRFVPKIKYDFRICELHGALFGEEFVTIFPTGKVGNILKYH
jgi:hypothetical protein